MLLRHQGFAEFVAVWRKTSLALSWPRIGLSLVQDLNYLLDGLCTRVLWLSSSLTSAMPGSCLYLSCTWYLVTPPETKRLKYVGITRGSTGSRSGKPLLVGHFASHHGSPRPCRSAITGTIHTDQATWFQNGENKIRPPRKRHKD